MGQRPAHLKPPAYLAANPPVPAPDGEPAKAVAGRPADEKPGRLEPTRYGDWEQNGIAVDF